MAIHVGNQKIKDVYFGSQKIKEAYYGNQRVYTSQIAIQDGYWVHKDTGVITYFGADADFIRNGIMGRPDWIPLAKEIYLCSGITGFKYITEVYEDDEWGDYEVSTCITFAENVIPDKDVYAINIVLEKLDFGNASISNADRFIYPDWDEDTWEPISKLRHVIFNNALTSTGADLLSDQPSLQIVDFGTSITYMDSYPFYECPSLSIIYIRASTPPSGEWRYSFTDPIPQGLQIKVPSASVNAYKSAVGSIYRNLIVAI